MKANNSAAMNCETYETMRQILVTRSMSLWVLLWIRVQDLSIGI